MTIYVWCVLSGEEEEGEGELRSFDEKRVWRTEQTTGWGRVGKVDGKRYVISR